MDIVEILIPVAHAGLVADAPSAASVVTNVFSFMLTISGTIGIIVLVVAGMLYLFARGDERLQQTAKRAMWGAVVGMFAIMGTMVIVRQLATFFTGSTTT